MFFESYRKRTFHQRCASLICFALILFFALNANAERLPIKTYTVADGLLRDNVYKIKQDSRGFLWFCTAEGISRFDGTAMTNFTVADGLPNRFANDFLETKSGTIYIATGKGLARLNPHGIRASQENPLFTVFTPNNPRAEDMQILLEDKNNQVWVGTSDGLYKLIEANGQIQFENVPLGESFKETIRVSEIIEDGRGALWIATENDGLLRLAPNGDSRRWTIADRLPGNNVASLLEDRSGKIWVGFRPSGGLCRLDGAAETIEKCYTMDDGLPTTWIPDLLQTSDGRIWVATTAGLCQWLGESASGASVCKTYTAKNDLCESVDALAEDKDGNLWTGADCGAKKIARYGFTTYTTADGLEENRINSILENAAGDFFVSTSSRRGINRFDGEKFSLAQPLLPKSIGYVGWGWQQTVWQDRAGAWWIPTGNGIFRSPDNTDFDTLARVPLEKFSLSKKGKEIFRLFEDSRGDIWAAVMRNEIWRWERAANRWHDYTAQAGLSPTRLASAFAEDRSGNVWIGTGSDDSREMNEGLLLRWRGNGQFDRFTHRKNAPRGWARDLFLDSRGRLWIASTGDGLRRIDDTNSDDLNFVGYTPAEGLTSLATASVTEDAFGRIYVGTWRGVDRLTPETGQVENLTIADGLPTSFVDNAYRDRQNNLWFGTLAGLARFVPEPPRNRVPPTILITGLRVGGESQSVSILGEAAIPPLDLNSQQRQITIDFLGLGASLGERLKYEYRLGDADWTATDERTLNFANLASGDYKFEVRAQTADRIYSSIATVSFKVAAPFWQRWWFVASALLLTAFAIYLFYKNRLARLLEIERMRTRIATDLHDDIGANLTRISLLSEVAKQKSTNGNGNLLTSIADIARESVASMNDIVWAISPDHDSLLDLTVRMRRHAEELFALRDIDLKFNAPASDADLKLSVGVRRDVLLIFKEAVNNAAKHSDCTRVAIDFRCENSVLFLSIADDGKSFDSAENYEGQGLRSMTRRARTLGGDLTIDSHQASGTTIELLLPLLKTSQV